MKQNLKLRRVWKAVGLSALLGLVLAPQGWAWGPHPSIGTAGTRVLPTNHPFRVYIQNDLGTVGNMSWMNDISAGGEPWGLRGMKIYARDFCFPVLTPGRGHGLPTDDESYEILFRRACQAIRMETLPNAFGWMGALFHITQDTAAPPHALNHMGKEHSPMENWLDSKQIVIDGYEPKCLGKTEDEALAGYLERMRDLRAYVLPRAETVLPLVRADDRPAAEPLILECALEAARAHADLVHTLGGLVDQLKPAPGTGTLRGTVATTSVPGGERFPVKVMLKGTPFSTLADLDGRFELRGLKPGNYEVLAMRPGSRPGSATAKVEADGTAELNMSLKPSDPPGNLLRNGDFSVNWIREFVSKPDWQGPDGWQRVLGANPHWISETAFVPTGSIVRLSVKWKENAEGEVKLIWRMRSGWKEEIPLTAPQSQQEFTAPLDRTAFAEQVRLYVKTPGDLQESLEYIAISITTNANK